MGASTRSCPHAVGGRKSLPPGEFRSGARKNESTKCRRVYMVKRTPTGICYSDNANALWGWAERFGGIPCLTHARPTPHPAHPSRGHLVALSQPWPSLPCSAVSPWPSRRTPRPRPPLRSTRSATVSSTRVRIAARSSRACGMRPRGRVRRRSPRLSAPRGAERGRLGYQPVPAAGRPQWEIWAPEFYDAQVLTVHRTATTNDDPALEASVQAVYRYRAVDNDRGASTASTWSRKPA